MPTTNLRPITRYISSTFGERRSHNAAGSSAPVLLEAARRAESVVHRPAERSAPRGYTVVPNPDRLHLPDFCASTNCRDCWPAQVSRPVPGSRAARCIAALAAAKDHAWSGLPAREGIQPRSLLGPITVEVNACCTSCGELIGPAHHPEGADHSWDREAYPVSDGNYVCNVCLGTENWQWGPYDGAFASDYVEVDGIAYSAGLAERILFYSRITEVYYASSADRSAAERLAHRARPVYEYHDTTAIDAHGGWPTVTPKDSLCFGVELEMEHKNNAYSNGCAALSDALGGRNGDDPKPNPNGGNYILMRDGSLNSSGVELITAPYTLEYHQSAFGWDAVLATVKDIGKSGKDTTACGMHVHCNRAAISALTLGKMLVFVNAEGNRALMARIAQRNSDRWARMYTKSIANGLDAQSDKYEALHITAKTIEFRIFRGNLRPARVLKNVEFCHSVVMFAKSASMKELNTHSAYLAWLGKNRGVYPNLVKFLGETYGFKDTAKKRAVAELDI